MAERVEGSREEDDKERRCLAAAYRITNKGAVGCLLANRRPLARAAPEGCPM